MFALASIAAPVRAQYRPPNEEGEEQEVDVQGTRRGSCVARDAFPELMVPERIALTISSEPKLLLRFPVALEVPVLVVLSDRAGNIFDRQSLVSKQGYVLVESSPQQALPEGNYYWTVIIKCRPQLAFNPYGRVEFKRVNPSSSSIRSIPKSFEFNQINDMDQIRLLAQQGIWYDAIALAYEGGMQSKPIFWGLLDDAGLEINYHNSF